MTKEYKRKDYINEMFVLRAVACLSIVLVHSIYFAGKIIPNSYLMGPIGSIAVLLTFGTPTFIFISMLLISYSYPNGLPSKFLTRRAKLILIPFISMAIFYALFYVLDSSAYVINYSTPQSILRYSLINIMGGYHGYFILIIFQFYLLYYIFDDYLSRKPPLLVILTSLVINLIYLSIFNFLPSPIDNKAVDYFWISWYQVPFLGWIFYFTLAYYCGKNYDIFLQTLNRYKNLVLLSTIPIGSLTVVLANLNIIPSSSKSIMMIFFTISMIGSIYFIATKIKTPPYFIIKISEYSFPIYFLHMFFLSIISKTIGIFEINWGVFSIVFLFIGSIVASMFTAYFLNKLKVGKYLVGRINTTTIKSQKTQLYNTIRS